jgi:hypothetical protein
VPVARVASGELTAVHAPAKVPQVPFAIATASRWSTPEVGSMPEPPVLSLPFATVTVTDVADW